MPLNTDDYNNLVGYLQSTGTDGSLSKKIADNVSKDPDSDTSKAYLKGATRFGAQADRQEGWRQFTGQFTGPANDAADAAGGNYTGQNNSMQAAHNADYQQMYQQYLAMHAARTQQPNQSITTDEPVPDAISGAAHTPRKQMMVDDQQRWLAMQNNIATDSASRDAADKFAQEGKLPTDAVSGAGHTPRKQMMADDQQRWLQMQQRKGMNPPDVVSGAAPTPDTTGDWYWNKQAGGGQQEAKQQIDPMQAYYDAQAQYEKIRNQISGDRMRKLYNQPAGPPQISAQHPSALAAQALMAPVAAYAQTAHPIAVPRHLANSEQLQQIQGLADSLIHPGQEVKE